MLGGDPIQNVHKALGASSGLLCCGVVVYNLFMENFTKEQIKSCRHSKYKWLTPILYFPLFFALLSFVSVAFQREAMTPYMHKTILKEFLIQSRFDSREYIKQSLQAAGCSYDFMDNSFVDAMSDVEVLDKLSLCMQAAPESILTKTYNFFVSWWHWWFLPAFFAAVFLLAASFLYVFYSTNKANGIRVTKEQFPRSYAIFEEMVQRLGFKKTPEFYVHNGMGQYNAFATCVPGYRNYTVIYSEILTNFENGGDENVFRFVMGHELGHLRLGHLFWIKMILNIIWSHIPGLGFIFGKPYIRMQEYEADKVGKLCCPTENGSSLVLLVASKELYKSVNIDDYLDNSLRKSKLSFVVANSMSDHPVIPWRIDAIRRGLQGKIFFPPKV